jgi:hypothetical protein
MSGAANESRRMPEADSSRQDRRLAGSNRVQFEALVEVGAGSTGGFEAESLDVSPDGMRLRTAYLPEPGETLVCRFDGFGGEVVADGQVIWCHEQGRGGEFGVRFTRLDERAAQLLDSMCTSTEADEPAADDAVPGVAQPGARVRLHIQGLGSPMRARVRDATAGEVLVGSNLEFLRVGRNVELEDVDQGRTQVAQIEHVDVTIDPETSIPQLIVALRYDGVPPSDQQRDSMDAVTSPLRTIVARAAGAGQLAELPRENTPGPTVVDRAQARSDETTDPSLEGPESDGYPRASAAYDDQADASGEAGHDDRASEADAPAAGSPGRLAIPRARASALARKIGPALSSAAQGARGVLGGILAKVRDKRQARQQRLAEAAAVAPLRTTAPPPTGALRSDGRRLFRESQPPPPVETAAPKRGVDRKRTAFGIVLGMMAVACIYFAATKVSAWQRGRADVPALSKPVPALRQAAGAPGSPEGVPPIGSAQVPLFGPTPLSTTEPVPTPTGVDSAMVAEGEAPGAPDTAGEGGEGSKPMALQKEWGVGSIKDPTVLKLKMDAAIDGFAGAEGATGFTLVVPNRKSVSSAAGLARKDKRVDSVNVVNFPDRCEITVHFKGEVPSYLAKVQDKALLIEIGSGGKGKAEASEDSAEEGDETKVSSGKSHKKKKDGAKKDGAKKDPAGGDDAKADGAKREGGKKDAAGADGAKKESSSHDGAKKDGAKKDGKKKGHAGESAAKSGKSDKDKKDKD